MALRWAKTSLLTFSLHWRDIPAIRVSVRCLSIVKVVVPPTFWGTSHFYIRCRPGHHQPWRRWLVLSAVVQLLCSSRASDFGNVGSSGTPVSARTDIIHNLRDVSINIRVGVQGGLGGEYVRLYALKMVFKFSNCSFRPHFDCSHWWRLMLDEWSELSTVTGG